jgi:hypothetical protein
MIVSAFLTAEDNYKLSSVPSGISNSAQQGISISSERQAA